MNRLAIIARCVYCGTTVRKAAGPQPAVCAGHRDLPALDPLYGPLALEDAARTRLSTRSTALSPTESAERSGVA